MKFARALVTGASSGIGRAIAVDLARRGVDLVVVARDRARLEALAVELTAGHGITVEVLAADLTAPFGRVAVERRLAEQPAVDLLVNNAGLGSYGELAGSDVTTEQAMVELNVTALLRLTTVASQVFRVRRRGGILHVSSVAGFQPMPGHATYGATKAFVTSLSEAVHEELRADGVHVTALCPGYTRTEFHERADVLVAGVPAGLWSTAADVARAGIDGVAANRAVVVPGGANRVVAGFSRVVSSAVTRRVAGLASRRGTGG
jgi:hypothetical protein